MILGTSIGLSQSAVQVPTVGLDLDAQIAALFGPSDEGAWYDPSDLTTLYQAANGAPVTGTGQPVGLMLDKSKGLTLEANEVLNSTFDAPTFWGIVNGGWVISGGVATSSATSSSQYLSTSAASTIVGAVYEVELEVTAYTSGDLVMFLGGQTTQALGINGPGIYRTKVVPPAVSTLRIYPTAAGFIGSIDNVYSRRIAGNHATQSTSTARPTLQLSGSSYYLDFDGVDDWMDASSVAAATQRTLGIARNVDVGASSCAVAYFMATVNSFGLYHFEDPPSYGFNTWSNDSFGVLSDRRGLTEVDVAYFVNGNPVTSGVTLSINGTPQTISQVRGTSQSRTMTTGFRLAASHTLVNQTLNGKIYAVVFTNRSLSADEQSSLESYLADKTGAFVAPVITGVPTISV